MNSDLMVCIQNIVYLLYQDVQHRKRIRDDKSMGTYQIDLPENSDNVTYCGSFPFKYIKKVAKKFIGIKSTTQIFIE